MQDESYAFSLTHLCIELGPASSHFETISCLAARNYVLQLLLQVLILIIVFKSCRR